MKKRRSWTTEEEKYLKKNYNKLSNKEIGKVLGRAPSSIRTKANYMGLKKSSKATMEELDFIRKNYNDMSDAKLGEALDLTISQVRYRRFNILNLKRKKRAKGKRIKQGEEGKLNKHEKENIKAYTAAYINLSSWDIGEGVCPKVSAAYIDQVKGHLRENNLINQYRKQFWGD